MGEHEDSRTVTGAGARAGAGPAIASGHCIGRYTVRSRIGAGGMGEVYSAEDSELGRTVALKLIRPDRLASSPTARLRLVREAQALARLHHPNVVCVHDVGSDGDQLFVAMELVEGPTLLDWLHERPRGWREVLDLYLAAGRGLAVAHQAGIVHRDFKPANVIVGKDRVVVVDFGLARAGDEEPAAAAAPGGGVLTTSLTMTGDYLGTPHYMAPEQRGGGEVTAQADQYAFCVALHDGLHGARAPGEPRRPPRPEVPGWVNQAVERGLAAEPAARWPSMDALLAELGRDHQVGRRRTLLVAGGVALAALAAWGLLRPRGADPCAGGEARLAGIWDGPTRGALERAFGASGVPFAASAWRGAQARLDGYTAGWLAMYLETCRATRVEGRQSDSLLDLRMACLDRRRALLGQLTSLWGRGLDRPAVEHADDAVSGLEPLAECADARALADRAQAAPGPDRAEAVARVRARLDAARAQLLAYRLPAASAEAAAVRREADGTGWLPLRAEAAFLEGSALAQARDPRAEPALLEAARLAGEARDDRLVARALTLVVRAVDWQAPGRALLAAGMAEAAVARTGDEELRAGLLRSRGLALLSEGRPADARAALLEARALLTAKVGAGDRQTLEVVALLVQVERALGNYAAARALGEENLSATIALLGPEHPQVLEVLQGLAAAATDDADPDAAVGYVERALAIAERAAGPDSAETAGVLHTLGWAERTRGHLDRAQALLERALAIRERVYGPQHSLVGTSLVNLGDLRRKQGRFEQGAALLERALGILTAAHGARSEKVAITLQKLGHLRLAQLDAAGALVHYQRALELRRALLGDAHAMTLYNRSLVGMALAQLHRCGQARPLLEEAAAGLEKAVGTGHSDYVGTLAPLAECDLVEGRPADALRRLERAAAYEEEKGKTPFDLGTTHLLLGRALWALGRPAEALAAARRAERELASTPEGVHPLAQARSWLRAHQAVAARGP